MNDVSFLGAGVLRCFVELLGLVGPVVLHQLVDTVHNWESDGNSSMWHVFGLGMVLFAIQVLQFITFHQCR